MVNDAAALCISEHIQYENIIICVFARTHACLSCFTRRNARSDCVLIIGRLLGLYLPIHAHLAFVRISPDPSTLCHRGEAVFCLNPMVKQDLENAYLSAASVDQFD
jgi:hypothetical protein